MKAVITYYSTTSQATPESVVNAPIVTVAQKIKVPKYQA